MLALVTATATAAVFQNAAVRGLWRAVSPVVLGRFLTLVLWSGSAEIRPLSDAISYPRSPR